MFFPLSLTIAGTTWKDFFFLFAAAVLAGLRQNSTKAQFVKVQLI